NVYSLIRGKEHQKHQKKNKQHHALDFAIGLIIIIIIIIINILYYYYYMGGVLQSLYTHLSNQTASDVGPRSLSQKSTPLFSWAYIISRVVFLRLRLHGRS
ncbi:hypothetical protein Tsubulata_004670, partial [Turnera subulata]